MHDKSLIVVKDLKKHYKKGDAEKHHLLLFV